MFDGLEGFFACGYSDGGGRKQLAKLQLGMDEIAQGIEGSKSTWRQQTRCACLNTEKQFQPESTVLERPKYAEAKVFPVSTAGGERPGIR